MFVTTSRSNMAALLFKWRLVSLLDLGIHQSDEYVLLLDSRLALNKAESAENIYTYRYRFHLLQGCGHNDQLPKGPFRFLDDELVV